MIPEIREGVKAIFKLKETGDIDEELTEKLEHKGFFGEIILYYLLKNLFNTIPLISKVYFIAPCIGIDTLESGGKVNSAVIGDG